MSIQTVMQSSSTPRKQPSDTSIDASRAAMRATAATIANTHIGWFYSPGTTIRLPRKQFTVLNEEVGERPGNFFAQVYFLRGTAAEADTIHSLPQVPDKKYAED
jgi:hypothetical protein